jgi:putative ABC transport system permease protein
MNWTTRVRDAFSNTPPVPEDDVIEELAQHARAMYDAARADGCSEEEAESRVAGQLGVWTKESSALRHRPRRPPAVLPPPAGSSSSFTGLAHDFRYAARLLRRQPRHSLVAILTMAVGIAVTTVLFGVTYGVLMKPLPWPSAERIAVIRETRGGTPPRFGDLTNAAYLAWREEAATIEQVAAWSPRAVTLTGAGNPERIRATAATASLFSVLGVRPLIGTFFEPKDETAPVVVLSERLWRERFGADPAVAGRSIQLDGAPHTIVGVLSDAHAFPDRQARAFVPFAVRPAAGNYLSLFNAVALLRPGVTAAQAAAEGTARGHFAADTGMTTQALFGNNGPIEITARPMQEDLGAGVRRPLIVLLIAVGLLLATATANVASLQLARAVGRRREMSIRAALGAGSGRVLRQLLVEGLLLGLLGGGVGLTLAALLTRSLPSLLPADFPRPDSLGVDAIVVAFALAASIGTGVAFGILPVLRVRRMNPVEALAEDGAAPAGGARSHTARARMLIIGGQVAIASVLLVGASLLGRSFLALLNADRGYQLASVLSSRLSMPQPMVPTPERRFLIVDQILERLAATPGITDAAFTSELPLTPGGSTSAFTLKSPKADGGIVTVQASPRIVSPRYFRALSIRTIAGRVFSDADTQASGPVVVVNQAFARRYLGESPLGAKLPVVAYERPAGVTDSTVIGVVDDARYPQAVENARPELYYSFRQFGGKLPVQTVTLLAKTPARGGAAASALSSAVREADPGLAADAIMPLADRLMLTLARPRLYATLLGGFAAFALIIAAVGLYGVLSYSVTERARELAIRTALGARHADILRLVIGQGLTVTIAGVAAGMAAATWLARLLASELYGIVPHDAFTFVIVPLVLVGIAALACFLPAHRAARLDPLRALKGS